MGNGARLGSTWSLFQISGAHLASAVRPLTAFPRFMPFPISAFTSGPFPLPFPLSFPLSFPVHFRFHFRFHSNFVRGPCRCKKYAQSCLHPMRHTNTGDGFGTGAKLSTAPGVDAHGTIACGKMVGHTLRALILGLVMAVMHGLQEVEVTGVCTISSRPAPESLMNGASNPSRSKESLPQIRVEMSQWVEATAWISGRVLSMHYCEGIGRTSRQNFGRALTVCSNYRPQSHPRTNVLQRSPSGSRRPMGGCETWAKRDCNSSPDSKNKALLAEQTF